MVLLSSETYTSAVYVCISSKLYHILDTYLNLRPRWSNYLFIVLRYASYIKQSIPSWVRNFRLRLGFMLSLLFAYVK